jgi:hypothetical protein
MHAWIGFFFSCTMIILAALGKSGYIWVPDSMAATPATEFMFLIGCAGFGAALALIAPSYSPARLASLWSSAALVFVVLIANVDDFNPHGNEIRTARPAVIVPAKPAQCQAWAEKHHPRRRLGAVQGFRTPGHCA